MAAPRTLSEAVPPPAVQAQAPAPARAPVTGPHIDATGKVVFPRGGRSAKKSPALPEGRGWALESAGNQAVQRLLTGAESVPAGLGESLRLPAAPRPGIKAPGGAAREGGAGQAGEAQAEGEQATAGERTGAAVARSGPRAAAPGAARTPAGMMRPASPETDPGFQAVSGRVQAKSKHGKAPPIIQAHAEQATDPQIKKAAADNSEIKKHDTKAAAVLPLDQQKKEAGEKGHLEEIDQTAQKQPAYTVKEFMGSFDDTVKKLGEKLPKNDNERGSDAQAAGMAAEKEAARQNLAQKNQSSAQPYRDEIQKNPASFQKPGLAAPVALQGDLVGGVQAVPNAQAAAPKPKKAEEVSLDDKSRDLDDLLANNSAGGHPVSVDEGSLAYPVSGEQSFDEAGEAKRKAQDEIAKAPPRYQREETPLLNHAKAEVRASVGSGLNKQLGLRKTQFGEILGQQQHSESEVVKRKAANAAKFHKAYEDTKKQVADDLKALDNIEGFLGIFLAKAQAHFDSSVKQQLEYIYTYGTFDYSDWIDEKGVQDRIKIHYANLGGDDLDGYERMNAWAKARREVQDEDAEKTLKLYKEIFMDSLRGDIERSIAPLVVSALNLAKYHITQGQEQVKKDYDQLSKEEKTEVDTVYDSVNQKFGLLAETVDAKKTEIINDMARTYNKSVGKLDARFQEIRKEVLTSWWEKAWNKIKAVVMAIIEFASRLFSLLGRLVGLAGDIISSPRAFFSNLVSGIGQGFSTFAKNLDTYLATAFFDWLRGAAGPAFQMPSDFGPSGLFSLFVQLLGLSTDTIWERMEVVYTKAIANTFRRGEQVVNKGLEVFAIVRSEGLSGLWEHIKESIGDIISETLDSIKEAILYAAIERVIIEIGKLLIPGGGFIAIAGKIIDLLKFIVQARDRIMDLIESFVDAAEMAVKGDVGGIAAKIIQALTRFITIAIDFLVSFFGLNDLHDKVVSVLNRIRQPVIKGIDWVLEKLKPLVMRLFGEKEPAMVAEKRPEHVPQAAEEHAAARPDAVHTGMDPAHPGAHGKAHPDEEAAQAGKPGQDAPHLTEAKRTVKHALDLHLPDGAAQVGEVQKVLDGVASKAAPALTHLHAQELNPGKEKPEGAIGFTARGKEPSGKETIVASVRITARVKMTHEDIRDRALIALAHGLEGEHTYADAEAILNRLGERLRPEGVKGFELSPETSEGQIDIQVSVNPKFPLGKLISQAKKKPKNRTVKAAIQLTLSEDQKVNPEVLQAASDRTSLPGAQILAQKNSKKIVQMVSWNTSDIDTAENDSHAEHQFVTWLKKSEQKNIRLNLEGLMIDMHSFSPCSQCSEQLALLLKNIRDEQEANGKTNFKAAHLYWAKLYSGQNLPTNWQGIKELRRAGWELHAPINQWPPEKITGLTAYPSIEDPVMWRLLPIASDPYTGPTRRHGN